MNCKVTDTIHDENVNEYIRKFTYSYFLAQPLPSIYIKTHLKENPITHKNKYCLFA